MNTQEEVIKSECGYKSKKTEGILELMELFGFFTNQCKYPASDIIYILQISTGGN